MAEPLPDLSALWDYDDPAATAVRFHKLLPLAVQSGNTGYHIELLTQIARTQSLQRDFDGAHAMLDEAAAMLTPGLPIAHMRYLLERGRAFNSAGSPVVAMPLFQEAYDLGVQTGPTADFFTVDAAHMLAIAAPTLAEQRQWNLTALDLARRSPDERAQGWRGSLLNNTGWAYFDEGNYAQALAIFQEASAWRQENDPPKSGTIRIARWCVARTLRALGRVEEAAALQQALLAEYEAGDAKQDGFVYEELGECLLALGQAAAARPYFAQAHALLSELSWLAADEPARLARLKDLAEGGE